MVRFYDVENQNGEIQRVPETWLADDSPFAGQFTKVDEQAKVAEYEAATAPNETWTKTQLTDYATSNSIDLGGAKLKADILTAITDAAAATTAPVSTTDAEISADTDATAPTEGEIGA